MHPKGGPLAAQVAGAAALAVVNPALAIAPFVDTGKKQDADCDKLMAEAREKGGSAAAPRGKIAAR